MSCMVAQTKIREFSRRLAREFKPDRIILFGSYAVGNPRADSDVDFLIIMPVRGDPVHKSVEIRMRLRPEFPVDLIIRTPANTRKRLAAGDDFLADIIKKGVVLYEAHGKRVA